MSTDDFNSFISACEDGNLEEVKKLVEKGVSVNQTNDYGDTALNFAISKGKREVVVFLLSKGADPNIKNKGGSTSLHKVAVAPFDRLVIAINLIKNNADPLIANNVGFLAEQLTTDRKVFEVIIGEELCKTEKVFVPKAKHGRLIGRAGENLREIKTSAGVMIDIPKPDDISEHVTIKGRQEAIDKAKKLIESSLSDEVEAKADGKTSVKFPVPKDKHKAIIGREGATIKRIREEADVEVIVPKPEDPDTNITIRGDADGIDAAIKMIQAETARNVTKYHVPKDKHRFIIGKAGATINKIRDETKVEITVPKPDDPDSNITIKGEQQQIDAAIKMILKELTPPKRVGSPAVGDDRRGSRDSNSSDGSNRGERRERPPRNNNNNNNNSEEKEVKE
eukprot:TRINITY_DN1139_c2_g1_i1.p1 TRINITY_DN1139_c2_g1~~TRINITY_DN1139_c2_g1_i1.p1  ORF type:complete len:394 (+),score=143.14 TRINITY_DN1139_c2_g1_i1:84-1265(+)